MCVLSFLVICLSIGFFLFDEHDILSGIPRERRGFTRKITHYFSSPVSTKSKGAPSGLGQGKEPSVLNRRNIQHHRKTSDMGETFEKDGKNRRPFRVKGRIESILWFITSFVINFCRRKHVQEPMNESSSVSFHLKSEQSGGLLLPSFINISCLLVKYYRKSFENIGVGGKWTIVSNVKFYKLGICVLRKVSVNQLTTLSNSSTCLITVFVSHFLGSSNKVSTLV